MKKPITYFVSLLMVASLLLVSYGSDVKEGIALNPNLGGIVE